MELQRLLNNLKIPPTEARFFEGLRDRSTPALTHWAQSYHYFSVTQATLLPLVVQALAPTDYRSLSEVTKALHEEYGSGDPQAIHSCLFARFCQAVGIPPDQLPAPARQVESSVLRYLGAIESGYRGEELATMVATYCFLERSAVLSYPLMLGRLESIGFSPSELEFFSTHVIQEAQHDLGASTMAARLVRTQRETRVFSKQLGVMEQAWSDFWVPFSP